MDLTTLHTTIRAIVRDGATTTPDARLLGRLTPAQRETVETWRRLAQQAGLSLATLTISLSVAGDPWQ